MPMSREEHEALLNKLLDREIETSQLTEVLQKLREDYTSVHVDFDEVTKKASRLEADNNDLIVSNSKMFRQLGVVGTPDEKIEKEKEFSETITLEALERG